MFSFLSVLRVVLCMLVILLVENIFIVGNGFLS